MSDSDSDDICNFRPLARKRRSADQSQSDSDSQLPVFISKRKSPYRGKEEDISKLLTELKGSVDKCREETTEIRQNTTEQATTQAKGLLSDIDICFYLYCL